MVAVLNELDAASGASRNCIPMNVEAEIQRIATGHPFSVVQAGMIPGAPPTNGMHLFVNLLDPSTSEVCLPDLRKNVVRFIFDVFQRGHLDEEPDSICVSIVRIMNGVSVRVYRLSVPASAKERMSEPEISPDDIPGYIESSQLPILQRLLDAGKKE